MIDPDVDEARRYLIEGLAYSQALHRIGFVTGMDGSSPEAPGTNLIGDPYYTDGLRAVLFFESRPFSLADLEFLDWEVPPGALSLKEEATPAKAQLFDDTALRTRAATKAADGIASQRRCRTPRRAARSSVST